MPISLAEVLSCFGEMSISLCSVIYTQCIKPVKTLKNTAYIPHRYGKHKKN